MCELFRVQAIDLWRNCKRIAGEMGTIYEQTRKSIAALFKQQYFLAVFKTVGGKVHTGN